MLVRYGIDGIVLRDGLWANSNVVVASLVVLLVCRWG